MQGESKRHKAMQVDDDDVQIFDDEAPAGASRTTTTMKTKTEDKGKAKFAKLWNERKAQTRSFSSIEQDDKFIFRVMFVEEDDQLIVNLLDRTRFEAFLKDPTTEDAKWKKIFRRLKKHRTCPADWAQDFKEEVLSFADWLAWSGLEADTERVQETVIDDVVQNQRIVAMPMRYLSLILYYWAYVRSVRLYGITRPGTRDRYVEYRYAVDEALAKAKNPKRKGPLEIKCINSDDGRNHLWHLLYGKTFQDRLNDGKYVSIRGHAGGYQRGYLPAQFYFVETKGFSMDCSLFRTFLAMPEFYWACFANGGKLKALTMFNSQDTECYFVMDCATNLEKVVLHGDAAMSIHSEPNTTENKNVRSEDILGVNLSAGPRTAEIMAAVTSLNEIDIQGFPQIRFLPTRQVAQTQMPFVHSCIIENVHTQQGCEHVEKFLEGLAERAGGKTGKKSSLSKLPATLGIGDLRAVGPEFVMKLTRNLPMEMESLSCSDMPQVVGIFYPNTVLPESFNVKRVALRRMDRLKVLDIAKVLNRARPLHIELSHMPQLDDKHLAIVLDDCTMTETLICTGLSVTDFRKSLKPMQASLKKLGIVSPAISQGQTLKIPFAILESLETMIGVISPAEAKGANAPKLPFDPEARREWLQAIELSKIGKRDRKEIEKEAQKVVEKRERAAELGQEQEESSSSAGGSIGFEDNPLIGEFDELDNEQLVDALLESGMPFGTQEKDAESGEFLIPPWFPSDLTNADGNKVRELLVNWNLWGAEVHQWLIGYAENDEGLLFFPRVFGDKESDADLQLERWDNREDEDPQRHTIGYTWYFQDADRNDRSVRKAVQKLVNGEIRALIILKCLTRKTREDEISGFSLQFPLRPFEVDKDFQRNEGIHVLMDSATNRTDTTVVTEFDYEDSLFKTRFRLGRIEVTKDYVRWHFYVRGIVQYLALQCFAYVCTYSESEVEIDTITNLSAAQRKKYFADRYPNLKPEAVKLFTSFIVKDPTKAFRWRDYRLEDGSLALEFALEIVATAALIDITRIREFDWTSQLSLKIIQVHQMAPQRLFQGRLLLVYLMASGLWSLMNDGKDGGIGDVFWRNHLESFMDKFLVRCTRWITANVPLRVELLTTERENTSSSLKRLIDDLQNRSEFVSAFYTSFVEQDYLDIILATDPSWDPTAVDHEFFLTLNLLSQILELFFEMELNEDGRAGRYIKDMRRVATEIEEGFLYPLAKVIKAARDAASATVASGDQQQQEEGEPSADESDTGENQSSGSPLQVQLNGELFFDYLQRNLYPDLAEEGYDALLVRLDDNLQRVRTLIEEFINSAKLSYSELTNEDFDVRADNEAMSPPKNDKPKKKESKFGKPMQVTENQEPYSPPKESATKRFKFREDIIEEGAELPVARRVLSFEPLVVPPVLVAADERALDNRRAQAAFEGLRDVDAIMRMTAPLPGNVGQVVVPATPPPPTHASAVLTRAEAAADREQAPVIKGGRGNASDPFVLEGRVYG